VAARLVRFVREASACEQSVSVPLVLVGRGLELYDGGHRWSLAIIDDLELLVGLIPEGSGALPPASAQTSEDVSKAAWTG